MSSIQNGHKLVLITGPTAVGKTTTVEKLLHRFAGSTEMISTTTRPKRPGEEHGKHYFFVSQRQFWKDVEKGDFLEWEQNFGNLYGASKTVLQKLVNEHSLVFQVIDVKGAINMKKLVPDACIIFLKPASKEELVKRIREERKNEENLEKRIEDLSFELEQEKHFEHVVINFRNRQEETVQKIIDIILV